MPQVASYTVCAYLRIALIVLLFGSAFALHFLFFTWSTELSPPGTSAIFAFLRCKLEDPQCLRIWFTDVASHNSIAAIVIGIVLPVVMILTAIGLRRLNKS